jgi:hypothetical protein
VDRFVKDKKTEELIFDKFIDKLRGSAGVQLAFIPADHYQLHLQNLL